MRDNIVCYTQDDINQMSEHYKTLTGIDFPGWYFWDETDSCAHGPFGMKDECEQNLKAYFDELLSEKQ